MANESRKKKKKPLRRAKRWVRQALAMAMRLAGFMVAVIVMGLIFSALQAIDNVGLRIGLSAVLTGGVLLLCMNEGMNKGAMDAAASRNYESMAARDLPVSDKEDAACFHPLFNMSVTDISRHAFSLRRNSSMRLRMPLVFPS